ncbi:MAG: hypothetical protein COV67_09770 [Nitrospinae bacterium CG11_big_fil_rev_8_21_14_0_20_56_8]|nr:MAG: hypothetical protein COV67_09770 [Nitrospinae bacterium CG11_big_fil_rev_8_21_14_0_20_56_8]
MYGIVQKNLPTDFNNFFARTGFFSQTEFMIGGRLMSLNDFEDEVIRPLGDARVHFALNRMTLGGPRLPREPFTAGDLNQQLESAAREFINDSVQVQVIDPARVARLSPLFHWYAEDFMKFAKARTYLEYVNRYRVKKIDDSFDVDFSDFDWMVNAR